MAIPESSALLKKIVPYLEIDFQISQYSPPAIYIFFKFLTFNKKFELCIFSEKIGLFALRRYIDIKYKFTHIFKEHLK